MVSLQELETVQLREASAAKEQAAAESALREAEAAMAEFAGVALTGTNTVLDPIQVKAPATGSVLHVFEENARVVAAGTPLMDIGDPTDIEVVVEVLSRDGAMTSPGTPVDLEQWGGGEPLKAKVRLIEPAAFTKVSALGVEEQRVNVVADLLTPPDQRRSVGDNFRVEARIIVWEARDVLKVPAGALFRKGDQWAAFVLADGRARLRIVKGGRSSGAETQVLEGLKQGEEVILYPGSRVTDGQRVTPVTL
jgi:HlyD family secretion protein